MLRLFDSTAHIATTVTDGYDELGRPYRIEGEPVAVPCRVSGPMAADIDAGRDGKTVIDAVLFFPAGTVICESDRIEVNGKAATQAKPAVEVSSPSGIRYTRLAIRWVSDPQ